MARVEDGGHACKDGEVVEVRDPPPTVRSPRLGSSKRKAIARSRSLS
jgi:hypothetical protein